MASFQSKIGWKRPRKPENKNHHSVSFLPGAKQQIKKKIAKKFQKIKNNVMDSFQAKIGWIMMRWRENKNFVPFRSYPTRNRKFQNNSKKIQKIKEYQYGFI